MFGSLKKKLKEGVAKLSGKMEEAPAEEVAKEAPKPPEPKVEKPRPAKPKPKLAPAPKPTEPKPEPVKEESASELPKLEPEPVKVEPEPPKLEPAPEPPKEKGRFAKLRERVSTKELTGKDIDDFFDESEIELLQSDVALGVSDSLKAKLKEKLIQSKVSRGSAAKAVQEAFRESLVEIVDQGSVNLLGLASKAKKEGKPLTMVFLGFNGAGKTTTIAKTASFLKKKGFGVVLAAGDTFRAASIEQLEVHGKRLGVKVIKHQYGSDSAAVIFDARKYAEKAGLDVVLADTAGRMHTDKNLMDELKKVIRVNSPELKVLVVDSLTGNDAVEQARNFHEAVGVDCVVMTKTDVNPRGGSILSVVHTIGKPILFLGTGQEYDKIEMFDPGKFVDQLLE